MEANVTTVGILLGILASVATAALAIVARTVQDHLNDVKEQDKLISLIRGELLNIDYHCSVVSREVKAMVKSDTDKKNKIKWLKRKHGDLSFIKVNLAKLGFLDEDIVKDFLQLALFIRNNDLEIDDIIAKLDQSPVDDNYVVDAAVRMGRRMNSASSIAQLLLNKPALNLSDPLQNSNYSRLWRYLPVRQWQRSI